MLSKDPSFFSEDATAANDTVSRHRLYGATLRARHPGSSIRIVTYTSRCAARSRDLGDGVTVYASRSRHRLSYPLDVVGIVKSIVSNEWIPDVVTAQSPWEEGSIAFRVARAQGAAFIPQLHFDLFSPEWLKESPLNWWRKRTAIRLFRAADRVRVVSSPLRRGVAECAAIDERNIDVIPVGVHYRPTESSKDEARARLWPELGSAPIVLFVGHFYAPKNLALWLAVAERIANQSPSAHFVLAGEGDERDALQARTAALGLGRRVRFLGSVPYAELPLLYAAADVFMLTSHYEGLGRVVVEAMMSGLPVVSTLCGGPEDVITDGVNGFLRPKGDVQALAGAVTELLDNAALRERFGAAGRKMLGQAFSAEATAEKLAASWEKAALERRR
jgi:glycosyltransferase involved in cell wall biosynthesis